MKKIKEREPQCKNIKFVANLKVFRIFMLVQKFILFIFRFLSLRKERKTHWKTTKKKENCMLAIKKQPYILGGLGEFVTGLFLAKGLMKLNIHHTRSLILPCSVLQQHRCLVAWSDLAKIASIVLSSTGSTSWWVIRQFS